MEQRSQLTKNKQLKEASTNSLYQSSFLPLLENATTQIKKLIGYYIYNGKSKVELRNRIMNLIQQVEKRLPPDLHDRQAYINGLWQRSNKWIEQYYNKAQIAFLGITTLIVKSIPTGERIPTINAPKDLVDIIVKDKRKLHLNMWSEQKAAVRVENYPQEINRIIGGLSKDTMVVSEPGKKPISLWQKAELDIRHEKQMKMLDDAKANGVELAWLSSHPDCSKRCEKWQGKLVSLTEHATMSGMRVKKVDGIWVYSLTDIMNQVDKYGYKNNIINGFNCRHHIIPYQKGVKPVEEYSKGEVAKQRAIEGNIRELEREIRLLKHKLNGYNIGNHFTREAKMEMRQLKIELNQKVALYKAYCEKNGYAWYQYRINI